MGSKVRDKGVVRFPLPRSNAEINKFEHPGDYATPQFKPPREGILDPADGENFRDYDALQT